MFFGECDDNSKEDDQQEGREEETLKKISPGPKEAVGDACRLFC
jgi:hypothetical protein